MEYNRCINVSVLLGKTLIEIKKDPFDKKLIFITSCGFIFHMYHDQECCEEVNLEEVIGELEDLIGVPILIAERRESNTDPKILPYAWNTQKWTFYELATINGRATLKWYGTSNGNHSESVEFYQVISPEDRE